MLNFLDGILEVIGMKNLLTAVQMHYGHLCLKDKNTATT